MGEPFLDRVCNCLEEKIDSKKLEETSGLSRGFAPEPALRARQFHLMKEEDRLELVMKRNVTG